MIVSNFEGRELDRVLPSGIRYTLEHYHTVFIISAPGVMNGQVQCLYSSDVYYEDPTICN